MNLISHIRFKIIIHNSPMQLYNVYEYDDIKLLFKTQFHDSHGRYLIGRAGSSTHFHRLQLIRTWSYIKKG